MKKNMGTLDRVLRLTAVAVIGILYFTGTIEGLIAMILGVAATAFFVTSLIGWCPVYLPLGLSTCKAHQPTTDD